MKAILLLHGILTDSHDFDDLLPYLDERYDLVYPITFPGHGKDDSYKNFKMEATFKLLLDTFDMLANKYKMIDVIGFSMGGALATYLSNKRHFNKLILVAPANKFLNWRMPIDMLSYFLKTLKDEEKIKKIRLSKKKYIEDVKTLNKVLHRMVPEYSVSSMITFLRIIDKCNKELRRIENPVLIIWGKLDPLVNQQSPIFDFDYCTNNQRKMVFYEDMSHVILNNQEKSAPAVKEILDFLDN